MNLRFALAEGPVHHIEILFASPHSYHLSLFCQERCKYCGRKAPQRKKARKARSPALAVQQCDRPLASDARLNASRQTGSIRAAQKFARTSLSSFFHVYLFFLIHVSFTWMCFLFPSVFHFDVSFFSIHIWLGCVFCSCPSMFTRVVFFWLKTKFCSFIIEFHVIEFALQISTFQHRICISISTTFSNITKRNTNSIHFKLQQ